MKKKEMRENELIKYSLNQKGQLKKLSKKSKKKGKKKKQLSTPHPKNETPINIIASLEKKTMKTNKGI